MSISTVNKAQQKQHIAATLKALPANQIHRMIVDHRFFYRWMLSEFPNRPVGGVALHQAIREGVTKDIAQYSTLSSVIAERFARRLSAFTGLTLWSLWSVQTWSASFWGWRQISYDVEACWRDKSGC